MKVQGRGDRTVWLEGSTVETINQPLLRHKFEIATLATHRDTTEAIKTMVLRGAGAIGAAAGRTRRLSWTRTEGLALAEAFPSGDNHPSRPAAVAGRVCL